MEEIDLKDLFQMFWKKKIQILIIVAIFMVIGLIYTIGFVSPVYTANTTLVLASSGNNKANGSEQITANDLTMNSKLIDTYSVLITSKDVIRRVKSNLNIDINEEELKKNIAVSSVKDTDVIQIDVTNSNGYYAEKIANELAKEFIDKEKEIYGIDNVQVVDYAETPDTPSNINHTKDIIIFTFVGVVIACMYVFITNMLDTTVKSSEDIENVYHIPVLVTIPMNEDEIIKNNKNKNKMKKGKRKGGRI